MSNFKQYEQRSITIGGETIYTYEDFPLNLSMEQLVGVAEGKSVNTLKEILEENSIDYFDNEFDCVEAYASANHLIESEDDLSERFDDMVKESLSCEIIQNLYHDKPMVSECFSGYVDSLQEIGVLHSLQVNQYGYVGKFSS